MTLPGDAFMNRAVTVVWATLALVTGTGAAAQAPSPGPQLRIGFVKSREILQSTPGYAAGIHVQQGSAGLSQRGAEAAATARLGRPGVRPAVDRALAHREAGEAEGAAVLAAARRAALQRTAGPGRSAGAGAARTHPAARQLGGAGAAGRRELRADPRRGRARLQHRGGGPGARPHEQGRAAPAAESLAVPPPCARKGRGKARFRGASPRGRSPP